LNFAPDTYYLPLLDTEKAYDILPTRDEYERLIGLIKGKAIEMREKGESGRMEFI
jgi:hypothetical protein